MYINKVKNAWGCQKQATAGAVSIRKQGTFLLLLHLKSQQRSGASELTSRVCMRSLHRHPASTLHSSGRTGCCTAAFDSWIPVQNDRREGSCDIPGPALVDTYIWDRLWPESWKLQT